MNPGSERARGVLMLIADDWSPLAGCYGTPGIQTPHIDGLARRAMRFDRAFCTTPSCAASRANILTGLYSHQHGQFGHCHGRFGFQTHRDIPSLPKVLADARVRTALIGKNHVAPREVYPFDVEERGDFWSNRSLAGLTRDFLTATGDRPFFAMAASLYPHRAGAEFPKAIGTDEERDQDVDYEPDEIEVPAFLPDVPEVRRDLAGYWRYVSRFDSFVGEQLRVLDESGRAGDTLVIVMSDHGLPFPGAKASSSDFGHRCPLLIAAPDGEAGATTVPASWNDLYPTTLDWLGVDAPPPPADVGERPGESLLPLLAGADVLPSGRDTVFFSHQTHETNNYWPYRVARTRRYQLTRHLRPETPLPMPIDLFDSPTWQAIRDTPRGDRLRRAEPEVLIDLDADPAGRRNLIDDPSHAEVAAQLRRELEAERWRTRDLWLEEDFQAGRTTLRPSAAKRA